jgi:hypothetical protein
MAPRHPHIARIVIPDTAHRPWHEYSLPSGRITPSTKMGRVNDDSPEDWRFDIQERSASVYDGMAMHTSGASIRLTGDDPDALLARLIDEANHLVPDERALRLEKFQASCVDQHNRITSTERSEGYIRARLRLRSTSDGGRRTAMASGYRSHWAFPPEVHAERHDAPLTFEAGPEHWLAPGEEATVRLHPLVPDLWPVVRPGLELTLLEGARVIGTARVLEVVAPAAR